MLNITSTANQTIKDLLKLKKPKERKGKGLIVIDGAREIEAAVRAGLEISSLFCCPSFLKESGIKIGNFFGVDNEKIITVSDIVFEKICYKDNPDGFLAIAKQPEIKLQDIKLGKNPLIVILENVEKPGNLGAIIRTAYAAGVTAIIVNDSQTDIYNPNAIRASEGYIFRINIVNVDLDATMKWLKGNNIKSFAAATSAKTLYTDENFREPSAVVLGSEADGLSEKWLESADKLVKIPMAAGMDSLNVSVSAAILVFEALRQRSVK